MFQFESIALARFFVAGLISFTTGLITVSAVVNQPPSVDVEVATQAQLATEDDAPVLPDDFAGNDSPRVSASWSDVTSEPDASEIQEPSTEVPAKPSLKFFTADGYPCPPCDTQIAALASGGITFDYETIGVRFSNDSPTGKTPCWKAEDGTILEGNHPVSRLNRFADEHAKPKPLPLPRTSEPVQPLRTVEVEIEGGNARSILSALAEHVRRESQPDGERVAQGLLPEIDVDLDDSLLAVIDSLLKPDGYKAGGLQLKWPGEVREISFSPAAEIRFEKIIQIDVQLDKLVVNGRKVTLSLQKFPDLTVRLK